MSSSTASFSFGSKDDRITCRCSKPVKVKTSRTPKNSGRMFYCCQRRECDFFLWVDVAQKQLNVIENYRFCEFAEKYFTRVTKLEMKVSELENATKEFEKKIKDLEDFNITYGKNVYFMRVLIAILVTLIFILVM